MQRIPVIGGNGRRDPYTAFNFLVEIGGIIVGGFNEVSGLTVETEIDTRREGGVNNYEYKLPKGTKLSNLTLKRGLSDIDDLWNWYCAVVNGSFIRKEITIFLCDESWQNALCWHFFKAFPIKWEGSTLNAQNNTIVTETLVLAHEGL